MSVIVFDWFLQHDCGSMRPSKITNMKKIIIAASLILLALPGMSEPNGQSALGLENAVARSGRNFDSDNVPGFAIALAAQERHQDALMRKPGIHGVGISQAEDGSAIVTVLADTSASAAGIPDTVDGVPVNVVKTGRFFALNVDCVGRGLKNCSSIEAEASAGTEPPHPSSWHPRPVPIGISTGHPDVTAGTIACRVSAGCHMYALSNAHVFADTNAGDIGDEILQPGPIDGGTHPADVIGTLYDYVPIVMSTDADNLVDAAIIATNASLVGTATRSNGYGTPRSQTVLPRYNMSVTKYGRTTSQTVAPIKIVNTSVNVGYGSAGTARFIGQMVIESPDSSDPFSKAGDSGALIVASGGSNDRKPVGLLFASTTDGVYTIANPINAVLDSFGVTIDGD